MVREHRTNTVATVFARQDPNKTQEDHDFRPFDDEIDFTNDQLDAYRGTKKSGGFFSMFNKRKQAAGAGAHGSVLVSEGRTDLSGNGAGAIADPNRDYLAAKSEAHTDMRFTSYLGNKERSNTNVLSMF